MKQVLTRLQKHLWNTRIHTTTTTNCEIWEETLVRENEYVYFSDIDYAMQSPAIWDALDHLRRMQTKLVKMGEAAQADEQLMEDMRGALRYWLDNDFTNPNWWFNQIGMVSNLAAVVIPLLDHLPEDLIARAADLIRRGSVAGAPAILQWTGANLSWGIRNTIYHALIIKDEALMRQAVDRIIKEIFVPEHPHDEGIKPDMSFYQHGQILYSCGYGRSFTYETALLIYLLSGSNFAIPTEKVELFERFVLDGQRYMMRGCGVDYQTVGREIARPGAVGSAAFVQALDYLLGTAECKRKDELAAYRASLLGEEDTFSSTKYFPNSYFLVHRSPRFHISVKGYHTIYKGTEWGLDENRLGYNLNYGGVMTMMYTGAEYNDFNPFTDYAKIPGTTAPAWDDKTLWDHSVDNWRSEAGSNDDCDGWSEDGYGILYMRAEHDGISGYKAYFAYPDGMVCLGCALGGPETLYTSVDQAFRTGETFAQRPVLRGESVVNGGFRYCNLSDAPMTTEAVNTEGAWSRNSPAQSAEILKADVFRAWIDHTAHSDYAYAVLAQDASPDKIAAIVNTPEEQSVTFTDGRRLAVVRENGVTRMEHT
ncbi:MAG: hypothetical protein IKZ09_10235 [Clostridia bacterium]|nr:hypothetical protein [Clostridia bacterium]